MNILFLDDDIDRQEKFAANFSDSTQVWNAADCIEKLKNQSWDLVSLDHDLNGIPFQDPAEENTGSAVVRWVVLNKPDVDKFVIHSYNHFQSPKMAETLKTSGYKVEIEPFSY